MKKLKKINRLYKKACLNHSKTKKAYRKAKAKKVKKDKLMKLWKKWLKAKYHKKALKVLLEWKRKETKAKNKERKAKKNKASAKTDLDKKIKNKKDKGTSTSTLTTKQSDNIGPAPVKTAPKTRSRKKVVPRRPVSKTPPSKPRTTVVKPNPSIQREDLKKVEGIGPKIEQILYAAGIKTWQALGNTSVGKLRIILAEAGPRFRMHSPVTWPRQAKLAERGKWTELKKLQEQLKKNK